MATAEGVLRNSTGASGRDTEALKGAGTAGRGGQGIIGRFFRREAKTSAGDLNYCQELAEKQPGNPTAQLKLAEIYQRLGMEEKAIAKYFQAGDIFSKTGSYPQAIAVYKHVLLMNSHLVQAQQKLAEIYRATGQFDEAVSRYRAVAKHYARWGRKDKIPEITEIINDLEGRKNRLDPAPDASAASLKIPGARPENLSLSASKLAAVATSPWEDKPALRKPEESRDRYFDLGAELSADRLVPGSAKDGVTTDCFSGFEDILRELQKTEISHEVYPDYHYHVGVACREMGFTDNAIEHFRIAFEKGEHPAESARLLSKCFREKGFFSEAQKYFEKAARLEEQSPSGPVFGGELALAQG
ncbi:MAG TPA: tetratricopeptide repeat protein [Thermodesulfobacteriota bacterium]|nr:tetratricopeptide repeat protein [Thermodesulfobacteriota bacterium]